MPKPRTPSSLQGWQGISGALLSLREQQAMRGGKIFYLETEDRYILDLEMEDYFDYEGFGEYISDKFYGKFVCRRLHLQRHRHKPAGHLISGRAYDDGRNVNMITAIIRIKRTPLFSNCPTAFTTFMKSYSLSALCSRRNRFR